MQVSWDIKRSCLHSPAPQDWSYLDWFRQIKSAAYNQGVELEIGPATTFAVEASIRQAILED
ncbi:hypothetical protein D3C72_2462890 [compost metagenome]